LYISNTHSSLSLRFGHPSFSKNFGLYGQRVGALSVVAGSSEEAKNVNSQMKIIIRPSYSNPPRHGARLVSTILGDETLTQDFIDQCKGMADRINDMRVALRGGLEGAGSTHDWGHVTKQIGMFAYSACLQMLSCSTDCPQRV